MRKAVIVVLYGVALYYILRKYYETNSGIPKPNALVGPTYLYGILALSADFLDALPVVLAAALTVALIWQTQNSTPKPGTKAQAATAQKATSQIAAKVG